MAEERTSVAKDQNVKQLVNANLITEFGGVEETPDFRNEGVAQHDYTYVPGFSDLRRKRDTELGQLARNEIRANEVSTLPVNVRWYRTVQGKGSEPDMMRAYAAQNQGYKAVTKADIGQPWLTRLPPGAIEAPDGTIRSSGGDLALYVINQQGAARNAYRKKKATEDMIDGMEMKAGGLGHVAQSHKGADPVVEKTIGGATK
jgi:hypothetical protein